MLHSPRRMKSAFVLLQIIFILVSPLSAYSEVDAREQLERIKERYQQLVADEKEYQESTQQYMDSTIKHLLETLGFAYLDTALEKKLPGDLAEDVSGLAKDIYSLRENYKAGIQGDTVEQERVLVGQIAGKIADKYGAGLAPDVVNAVFDILYLYQDSKQREALELRRQDLDKAQDYWS